MTPWWNAEVLNVSSKIEFVMPLNLYDGDK